MTDVDRTSARLKIGMALAIGISLLPTTILSAGAETVRWRTIVGASTVSLNEATTPATPVPNSVGNIPPAGLPWSALRGRAMVDLATGLVAFEVEGLALGGNSAIGTPDTITQVKGTVACVVGSTTVALDTILVPLSAEGNAEFFGSVGPIPSVCMPSNVVFLIRRDIGRYIAYGAVRSSQ
jgi:hypothetical protein